jgi:membrane protein
LLLWVYYSAQIFLLGAEFTKVYAHRHGSQARRWMNWQFWQRPHAGKPPAPPSASQPR